MALDQTNQKKIIVTGGTGLIGSKLSHKLIEKGYDVYIFTRDPDEARKTLPFVKNFIKWDYKKPDLWKEYLNNTYGIIHLAGANLFTRRWNEKYKKVIIESRELGTRSIVNAVKAAHKKPVVLISASGIGFYGESGDKELTEDCPAGTDFLAHVCGVWEREAAKIEEAGVRWVSIRTGLVLSTEEGFLKEFLLPFKMFVGGPIGSGQQWQSWVHVDDVVDTYIFALENDSLNGPVNTAALNPVRMNDFTKQLGKVLHRPSYFKVPNFALRLVVGEIGEYITFSQLVIPKKLMKAGFKFKFNNLRDALTDLLKSK